jgi:hypothetical protein
MEKIATRITALLNDINPHPTVVPIQFAVSFAPIFQPT